MQGSRQAERRRGDVGHRSTVSLRPSSGRAVSSGGASPAVLSVDGNSSWVLLFCSLSSSRLRTLAARAVRIPRRLQRRPPEIIGAASAHGREGRPQCQALEVPLSGSAVAAGRDGGDGCYALFRRGSRFAVPNVRSRQPPGSCERPGDRRSCVRCALGARSGWSPALPRATRRAQCDRSKCLELASGRATTSR